MSRVTHPHTSAKKLKEESFLQGKLSFLFECKWNKGRTFLQQDHCDTMPLATISRTIYYSLLPFPVPVISVISQQCLFKIFQQKKKELNGKSTLAKRKSAFLKLTRSEFFHSLQRSQNFTAQTVQLQSHKAPHV